MWTDEQRKAASERAKQRWANQEFKDRLSELRKKTPMCPLCRETDISKFYVDKNGRRTNKYCRECHKQECKRRWHDRSKLDRWASRNYKYGVSKEFLLELFEKQNGKCAICKEESTTSRGLHVDHCHKTKAVRGLLCHGCNTGLGLFKDNQTLLSNAISYLKE